ncbi:MAG: alpha-D-ribose 1-methylphosphonate 5-triphosphate diphosphatase [Acidimicrobiales bacterium]
MDDSLTERRWSVTNVRAVLPDRVIDDATVVAEDGLIAAVEPAGRRPVDAIDGRGAYCLPGLVDLHSGALERELVRRPGEPHDVGSSVVDCGDRLRAAGITTAFHSVAFGGERAAGHSAARACRLVDAIAEHRARGGARLDHRVLHRLDARTSDGFDALVVKLSTGEHHGVPKLVSFDASPPGRGHLRGDVLAERERTLGWLSWEASAKRVRLAVHRPSSEADIVDASRRGASVAEFPRTLQAARAAAEAGMGNVMSAPRTLRGSAQGGVVDVEELLALGLCAALAGAYLPSTMLAAVFVLAARRAASLPRAVQLVTDGPAQAVGLKERGRLLPGCRADAVLVGLERGLPVVQAVLDANASAAAALAR